MARARTVAGEIVRQLNLLDSPVYILDQQRAIVFCNEACAAWVGTTVAELQDQVLHYRSPAPADATPAEAASGSAADGLCPPPEVFSGTALSATVAAFHPQDGLKQARTDFFPLLDSTGQASLIIGAFTARAVTGESSSPPKSVLPQVNDHETEQLRALLRSYRQRLKSRYMAAQLVGESPAMKRVRQQVLVAAGCNQSVLIVGPAGSGRQSIARTIHYSSADSVERPLVPLSCSTLPPELLLSTVRALMAKRSDRDAAASSIACGTLLLTDIECLAIEAQLELLNLIDQMPELRVVSTSTKFLLGQGSGAQFKPELAHALSTLVIEVLPLGDRPEDIPVLAQACVEQLNGQSSRQLRGFTSEALDQLAAYDWPGNFAQLQDVVRSAHEKAKPPEIGPADLPEVVRFAAAQRAPRKREEPIDLSALLMKVELELITRAMRKARGNKTRAAKLLGMTRPKLYRRMIQLGLIQS